MNTKSSDTDKGFTAKSPLSEILRNARKSAGIDIDTLSSDLKIQKEFITALENGDFQNLPAAPYTRAFLITLSKRLNLNSSDIINQFNEVKYQPGSTPTEKPEQSSAPPDKKFKKYPIILVSILSLILIVCLFSLRDNRTHLIEKVSSENNANPAIIPEDNIQLSDSLYHDSIDSQTINNTEEEASQEDIIDKPSQEEKKTVPKKIIERSADELSHFENNVVEGKYSFFILKGVTDSVWVTVSRKGQKSSNNLLFRDDIWKVSHTDTIFIKTGVPGGVEFSINTVKSVPERRKITVFNGAIIN